ncbi:MAG: Cation diffusion facilitator family transporter [Ilumatobacteraceae bacterium]|nr:Cation diffusion facilitator family transporter [Ilumatobacteraceae bacterium]MCU1391407.1 Cation diffusion facilitator family transporter [Ilumatobacteraceae bacterium]
MEEGSRKAIVAAFFANLGIAVSKFVGFLITGSAGLLAEAAHSLADTGNQALLMLGGKRSQQKPNGRHQFGYGNERYFWAFVVALVLFSGGGLFALYEGTQKLLHPHEADSIGVAIGILLAAVALESFSLMTAVREVNHVRPEGMSYWRFVRTAKQPELPIVLLEDVGAEIGLLFALFGLLMTHLTGNARWDAVGSVAIGLLLMFIASILAVRMKALLIGESASTSDQDAIIAALTGSAEVERIIHIRTLYFGPDELLVAAKLGFAADLTVATLAQAVDAAEAAVRAAVPTVDLIYIEPDLYRETV